jgi:hypothetical protein
VSVLLGPSSLDFLLIFDTVLVLTEALGALVVVVALDAILALVLAGSLGWDRAWLLVGMTLLISITTHLTSS